MNKFFRLLLVAAFLPSLLASCSEAGTELQTAGRPMAYTVLKPGEKIGDMVITSDVKRAFPLWSFCLPIRESDHLITIGCSEVSFDTLAIGHTFGVMDLVPAHVQWEELNWRLAVDGWAVDLEAFGTYDFVHPDLTSNSSPVREVFRSIRPRIPV